MSLLDTPKLGFGLMRLPTMPGEPDRIDIEQTKTMVDMFMEAGLTYFAGHQDQRVSHGRE